MNQFTLRPAAISPRPASSTRPVLKSSAKRPQTAKAKEKGLSWLMKLTALGSFCGLTWQIYDLCSNYFEYDTGTDLAVEIKSEFARPALSSCFLYNEILDQEELKGLYPQLHALWVNKSTLSLTDTGPFFSVADIFTLTPNIDDIVLSCTYRMPRRFHLLKATPEECKQFFVFKKYYTQLYICYAFVPLAQMMDVNVTWAKDDAEKQAIRSSELFEHVRGALEQPGLLFQVTLNKTLLASSTAIRFSLHQLEQIPRGGVAFPTIVFRNKVNFEIRPPMPPPGKNPAPTTKPPPPNKVVNVKDSEFSITYSSVKKDFLGEPFSNCINYVDIGFFSKEHCVDLCLIEMVAKAFDKLPFSPVYEVPDARKLLSSTDVENDTVIQQLNVLQTVCDSKCGRIDCSQKLYTTRFIKSRDNKDFVFKVYLKDEPDITATASQSNLLTSFIANVLGCFGSWFDVSFVTLNFLFYLLGNFINNCHYDLV